jgi:hypothetical protein
MLSRQAEKETPCRFRIPTRFCIFPGRYSVQGQIMAGLCPQSFYKQPRVRRNDY